MPNHWRISKMAKFIACCNIISKHIIIPVNQSFNYLIICSSPLSSPRLTHFTNSTQRAWRLQRDLLNTSHYRTQDICKCYALLLVRSSQNNVYNRTYVYELAGRDRSMKCEKTDDCCVGRWVVSCFNLNNGTLLLYVNAVQELSNVESSDSRQTSTMQVGCWLWYLIYVGSFYQYSVLCRLVFLYCHSLSHSHSENLLASQHVSAKVRKMVIDTVNATSAVCSWWRMTYLISADFPSPAMMTLMGKCAYTARILYCHPSVRPLIMLATAALAVRNWATCFLPPCHTANLTLLPFGDFTTRISMFICLRFWEGGGPSSQHYHSVDNVFEPSPSTPMLLHTSSSKDHYSTLTADLTFSLPQAPIY